MKLHHCDEILVIEKLIKHQTLFDNFLKLLLISCPSISGVISYATEILTKPSKKNTP